MPLISDMGKWGILMALLPAIAHGGQALFNNSTHIFEMSPDGTLHISSKDSASVFQFEPVFLVLSETRDPGLALRPADLGVSYNVATWNLPVGTGTDAAFTARERDESQHGDGFDDRILARGRGERRTANPFRAGTLQQIRATAYTVSGREVAYSFSGSEQFDFHARLTLPEAGYPILEYTIHPKADRYFSVAYAGAPSHAPDLVEEIWQPLIWTEKRFPVQSFLTLAFRCPLPTAFAQVGGHTIGVLADPAEYGFDPLPMLHNSRFGVSIRNREGEAQPLLFSPVLGGHGSFMRAGDSFSFKCRLLVERAPIIETYGRIARDLFGFRDYRDNALGSLNEVIDRMVDYGLSEYAYFNARLKGCSYSTDVPDAVKNVSSLNPLNIALLRDDPRIFEERAYPMMEYLLSREKFLFSLDPEQKIQNPSRRMAGPASPLSELTSLYNISQASNPVLVSLARDLYGVDRVLNLDLMVKGDRWQNSLALYQATGVIDYLEKAMRDADVYLERHCTTAQAAFEDNPFFWTSHVPDFSALIELYEATSEVKYLQAAHQAARRFCLYIWMSPAIPDQPVLVNKGGEAPVYWYLKRYREAPMQVPEEWVPAWRLSETGLTPESSGTSSGHRAILMANFAPWLLRISGYTGDAFLEQVARAAVVGRYRNFPGYHINTARTTIYEKADYPLREHDEINVNSFHYNHIWPQISSLYDFIVTETWKRSDRAICFPSAYVEGYAYLQNKVYGHRPGMFHGFNDAVLWMPKGLFRSSSGQLNGLSARGEGRAYFAFTNQADYPVESTIHFDRGLLNAKSVELPVQVWINNEPVPAMNLVGDSLNLVVPAKGIAAIAMEGVDPRAPFQQSVFGLTSADAWEADYLESTFGGARAMILNWGTGRERAFIYLQADDSVYSQTSLHLPDGSIRTDTDYPYEFTVLVPDGSEDFTFELSAISVGGGEVRSKPMSLRRNLP